MNNECSADTLRSQHESPRINETVIPVYTPSDPIIIVLFTHLFRAARNADKPDHILPECAVMKMLSSPPYGCLRSFPNRSLRRAWEISGLCAEIDLWERSILSQFKCTSRD